MPEPEGEKPNTRDEPQGTPPDTTPEAATEAPSVSPSPANMPQTRPTDQPVPDELPLGEAGKRAIVAERSARSELEKQLREAKKQLAKITDKDASELEKANRRLAEVETQLATETQQRLQLHVASAHDIPADLLHLLTGGSEAELTKQAESLKPLLAARATPAFAPNPGQGRGTSAPADRASRVAAAEQAGQWDVAQQLKTEQLMEQRKHV